MTSERMFGIGGSEEVVSPQCWNVDLLLTDCPTRDSALTWIDYWVALTSQYPTMCQSLSQLHTNLPVSFLLCLYLTELWDWLWLRNKRSQ